MNVLICHDRYLFRCEVDQALIMLGKGLKKLGHTIEVMATRCSPEVVADFASRVISCPTGGAGCLDDDEFTVEWLQNNWNGLFFSGNLPDVIIVGGSPFLAALTFFREVCQEVIFVDFGAAPSFGFSESVVARCEKVRRLRRRHLQDASLIVSSSQFVANSQSRPDSCNAVRVETILPGANEEDRTPWPAIFHVADNHLADKHERALNLIQALRTAGKKTLFCFGTWELNSYRNSRAALELMEQLTASHPDCVLLVQTSKIDVPEHLRKAILPIGFPEPQELTRIMNEVDVGICTSLWEGFNLPLAQMQWLGTPVLAFNVAAHPEVVLNPWCLCSDTREMSVKAGELLLGRGPEADVAAKLRDTFRDYFRWDSFVKQYSELLTRSTKKTFGHKRRPQPTLLVDVTSSTQDPSNPGVIRVTRRLSRELQRLGEDPRFVVWEQSQQRYVLPVQAEYDTLGRFNGPSTTNADRVSRSVEFRTAVDDILAGHESQTPWLLLPEVMMENCFRGARDFARNRNFKIAAVFYDSIPVLRPDLCNEQIVRNHQHYMLGLAECDVVLPISNFSNKCLEDFWNEAGVSTACRVIPDVLPGEFGGSGRVTRPPAFENGARTNILCVSTLEPRKNHRNLIEACLQMATQHPELDWVLTLVGTRYVGAFEIADWIQEVAANNTRIKWLGVVDDTTLERLYREASFTIYPSIIEGFGLPVLESIWHGRPCICHNQGVMAELADGGGCFTTDVTDPPEFSNAIYKLASDGDFRLKLSCEAVNRPLRTWHDYTFELTEAIRTRTDLPKVLEGALYPDCSCENWRMDDAERMALTGLLARHKPHCSIVIGTTRDGSVSLASQYSDLVFSISADATVHSPASFPNVSFLSGCSADLLPLLLDELDRADTPLDFVFVDGDNSATGIRSDIACLLAYVPKQPLFVLLHESFNPRYRREMLEAVWETSPYCHWVDIDFVPGRINETPEQSQGELCGGLAAAYFLPVTRHGEVKIGRTADKTFRALTASLHAGAKA